MSETGIWEGSGRGVAHLRTQAPLTAAGLQTLCQEYTHTIEPARLLSADALGLERTLAHLVNPLTPEETALFWSTAPPRIPIPPPARIPESV